MCKSFGYLNLLYCDVFYENLMKKVYLKRFCIEVG